MTQYKMTADKWTVTIYTLTLVGFDIYIMISCILIGAITLTIGLILGGISSIMMLFFLFGYLIRDDEPRI